MYYNSILWHGKESQTHRMEQPNWGQDTTTCIDMSDGYTNLWYYTYFAEKILLRSINCLIFLRIVKLQVLKNFITTAKKKNAKNWQAAQYVNPPSFFTQLKLRTKPCKKSSFKSFLTRHAKLNFGEVLACVAVVLMPLQPTTLIIPSCLHCSVTVLVFVFFTYNFLITSSMAWYNLES